MASSTLHLTLAVRYADGRPFVETRARSRDGAAGPVPPGKVLVVRIPILPPGAPEEAVRRGTETLLEDEEGRGLHRAAAPRPTAALE